MILPTKAYEELLEPLADAACLNRSCKASLHHRPLIRHLAGRKSNMPPYNPDDRETAN